MIHKSWPGFHFAVLAVSIIRPYSRLVFMSMLCCDLAPIHIVSFSFDIYAV